jgi:prepilin-type N-terminal cleavage/methylation domain-containing protein
MIPKVLESRRGMTLPEMLIALLVFSAVMAGALSYLRQESRSFNLIGDRMTLLQNLRYAGNTLEQSVRAAGTGVPDQQPYLVYAGATSFAFNANFVTNIANDVFAVYYDPDAPTGTVAALTQAERVTLPGTGFSYPDTTYLVAGTNSQAETITFFFEADTSTARSDDYVLYRQVNAQPPEVVARDLLQVPGVPFFRYYWVRTAAGGVQAIDSVPDAQLPWAHSVPTHLAPTDTGAVARVDSIRGVRVTFMSTNAREGAAQRVRQYSRIFRMPNAGLATRKTCGDEPMLGVALKAEVKDVAGQKVVELTWNPAVDENGGERDVVRYVLWRRFQATPGWGEPYLSIPAGSPSYIYTDAAVIQDSSYVYALAAQDCTPSQSSLSTAGPVKINDDDDDD